MLCAPIAAWLGCWSPDMINYSLGRCNGPPPLKSFASTTVEEKLVKDSGSVGKSQISRDKLRRRSLLAPVRKWVKYSGSEASFPNCGISSRSRWETHSHGVPPVKCPKGRTVVRVEISPRSEVPRATRWVTTANDGPGARLEGGLIPCPQRSPIFSVGRAWV